MNTSREQLSALDLPEEAHPLLHRLGAEVLRVQAITARSSRLPRATFRLDLADGRTVKLRRCTCRSTARRVLAMWPLLPAQHFARILDSGGSCLLEEWIAGHCLADHEVTAADLRSSGRLLAKVHASAPPGTARMRDTAPVLRYLFGAVHAIARAGLISPRQRALFEDTAQQLSPLRACWSVVHRDFGPDNLVASRGRIVGIDNATVRFGFIEDDLATWRYRWPMSSAQREEFLSGYADAGGEPALLKPNEFWSLVAVTRAAAYRLRAGAHDPAAPLRHLPPRLCRV